MHMGSLTNYTATRHFRELLPIYLDPQRSLLAAKAIMSHRIERMKRIGGKQAQQRLKQRHIFGLSEICASFDHDLGVCTSSNQLLGFEGNFSKRCYAEFAKMSGLSKVKVFRREPGAGISDQCVFDPVRQVNRLIDHGNYLCYGMAGAALWALGIPPHMSVLHGKTRAGGLVFDLADSFKDALVLPLAFSLAREKSSREAEHVFRGRLIAAFDDNAILKEAIRSVEMMIEVGDPTAGLKHA